MLIGYLKEKNFPFTEKKVDQDKNAEVEMAQASGGFLGVPFTVIEKDGNNQAVIGFDKNKLDTILGVS
jgi:glutaredoxin